MKQLPKILEARDKEWREFDFYLVYIGQHPDNPDCAVYATKDMHKGRKTGYPYVYLVYDNKYDEITGFKALDIISKLSDDE